MPNLPKRPCAVPWCYTLVTSGRCEKHTRQVEVQRGNAVERGYGGAHLRLRVRCFERDNWTCKACGWQPLIVEQCAEAGIPVPTEEVLEILRKAYGKKHTHLHADHKLTIEKRPDLRHDLDNMQTLCNRCHSQKTFRETGRHISN